MGKGCCGWEVYCANFGRFVFFFFLSLSGNGLAGELLLV